MDGAIANIFTSFMTRALSKSGQKVTQAIALFSPCKRYKIQHMPA
jgi:chromosome segregation and condensation protein ScpB